MPDYFAILGVPRQPSVDLDHLKQQFLRLSAELHPDKAPAGQKVEAQQRFAEVNTAYNCLRQTRERLLHLLELAGVPKSPHVQAAPAEVLEFFERVAKLTRETDEFLARKRQITSPLLKAQLFGQGLEWADRIQSLQSKIAARIQTLESSLPQSTLADLGHLQQIAAALGFLQRWQAQLQERLTALAL